MPQTLKHSMCGESERNCVTDTAKCNYEIMSSYTRSEEKSFVKTGDPVVQFVEAEYEEE